METPPEECHTEDWTLRAGVQDSDSGLGEVLVNSGGGGNLTADFVVGTKEQVVVEYATSCCNSNVSLTLVDIFGNWAIGCSINLGNLFCSTNSYCTATEENLIKKIRDVQTENSCRSLCRSR